MSRAPRIQRLLQTTSANVISIEADGDCFYSAVTKALQLDINLRDVVAAAISINELQFYKMLTNANVPGYERCAQCNTLEELQALIRQPKTIWADQFSLETIATHLNCHIWIIDDGAARNKFVCVGGNKIDTEGEIDFRDVVLLHRTRRQHYNLVTIDNKSATPFQEMSETIRRLFGYEEMNTTSVNGATSSSSSSSASKGEEDVKHDRDVHDVSTSSSSSSSSFKGDEDEDVKQNNEQNPKTSLLKRDRRVAFSADTDFNASQSPSEEDDVDDNTSGKYVRGPSRAQQKRRKASIQKWNDAYSCGTTKKS